MKQLYSIVIARGWWVIVAVCLALGALALAQFRHLGIEFQTKTLLDEKDEELGEYQKLHDTSSWGESEFAVVCASGIDWVSEQGILHLRELVTDLEKAPQVGRTMSLLDIPLFRQNPEQQPNLLTLATGKTKHLREPGETKWPEARVELIEHELAGGTLISRDGDSTNILVYLSPAADGTTDTQPRWQELVAGLREVTGRWNAKLPQKIKLAGVPVVYTYIIERVAHDLRIFGVAAAVLFSAGLFLVYRRARFVILPLLTSVLPVVLVLGYMAVAGVRFTVITSNLPLLLFVLALPYTIYITERYLERRARHPEENNLASVLEAARAMWIPCLFSALATVAGFGAFATSGILPVRLFGVLMSVGTLVGLAVVFLFFPAAQRPWPPISIRAQNGSRFHLATWFARIAVARPVAVVALSAVVLLGGIAGAFRLTAENKFTSYFWPSSEVYQGLEFIDRNLGGTSTLEIYLKSTEPGFFEKQEGLAAIAAVEEFFKRVPEVGSLRTLNSLVREARKTFKPEWFPTMEDGALLRLVHTKAPELFQDIMNDDGSEASLQVRLEETAPTLNRRHILDALDRHLAALEPTALKGLGVETTGIFVLYANMLETLIDSQRDTLGFVIIAIFLMLLALFRSFRLALIVLLPQALPAVTMLGVMGWFRIPLDLVTVMISAIALGVGVDSAIQYTMRFREELGVDGDVAAAVGRAHATVGRAIWVATTVIVAGFAVLMASDFFPSVWFGLFTGLAMLMSQFSALLTLPSLILWLGPRWGLFGARGVSG
jgi:uncharacterized protein